MSKVIRSYTNKILERKRAESECITESKERENSEMEGASKMENK